MPELLSKNPILRREIDLPEKFGQKNTLYFPKFSGKMCYFRTKQLWNCTLKTSISPSFTQKRNGKEEPIGNPKFWQKKLMLWGLWNDNFDQIFADFSEKSIAGIVFGRKIAAR